MGNRQDWSWKPPEEVREALKLGSRKKRITKEDRKRKKKGKKRLTKTEKLARLPASKFYRLKRWRYLRWQVFARDGRRCSKCDAVDVELHIDHIKPRSKFPRLAFSLDNLQVLCRTCNLEKSNKHCTDYRDEAATRELDRQALANAPEL